MNSRIIKGIAGFYYVHDGEKVYECKARGLFRKQGIKPLVGDFVDFEVLDEKSLKGSILQIKERRVSLIRPAVANPDLMLLVFSGAKPEPNLNLLDRFLVWMESMALPVAIVFTKSDLTPPEKMETLINTYKENYKVFPVSVHKKEGLLELKHFLRDKLSVLAGPSGVGKSTLTNFLVPSAAMEVGEISRKIERGKQTTRHTELFYAGEGAYICDTPGFGSVNLFSFDKWELKKFFPEFSRFDEGCAFKDCLHCGERVCSVKTAVREGKLSFTRYENYKLMLHELIQKKEY